MPRGFRGFNPRFMKAVDRSISPIAFLPSSTQPAVVETITVKNIGGSLTILLVSTLEISNGHLTPGAPNTSILDLGGSVGAGMQLFLSGGFS